MNLLNLITRRISINLSLIKFIINQEANYLSSGGNEPELNLGEDAIAEVNNEIKQKIEFNFDGYSFSYYKKTKRLNITNNDDGKTLTINDEKCVSNDYSIINYSFMPFGHCEKVENTPIIFNLEKDSIKITFDYSSIVFTFF